MTDTVEARIGEWRDYVLKKTAILPDEVDELETHLREQIVDLESVGLSTDEAFLIAVGRIGATDDLSGEFAREHSGRLWKQLIPTESAVKNDWMAAIGFAFGAAVVTQVARYAAGFPETQAPWLARNLAILILPFLAGYFAYRRGLSGRKILGLAIPFVVSAVLINLYPFSPGAAGDLFSRTLGSTELLVAVALPVALWFVVGYAYTGGDLSSRQRRMDFVRFTGEWVIYYTLIAIGGGVLLTITAGVLGPTGADAEAVINWVVGPGAAGAVVISAWLVETKQRVVENMAPVLTMIFTPLFAIMLAAAVVVYLVNGLGFDRDLLFVFDALLVVVLGLVLYGISAREPDPRPGWMDRVQLIVVVSALVLDLLVLGTMIARIGELGFTPNRTAALGLNLILLINLARSAWLAFRFQTGRSTFHLLERWQTSYLPVFAAWAAIVALAFPPLFGFI